MINKAGCVVPMLIVSILPHAEIGPNDHRKDASHFTIIQNRFGPYLLMKWMVLSWWQKKIYLNPMLIFSASQIFKKNNRSYGYAIIIKMIILLSTILDKRCQRISKTWKSWLQSRIRYFDWSWKNKIEIQQIFIKLCPSFATSTRKRRTNFGQLSSFFLFC